MAEAEDEAAAIALRAIAYNTASIGGLPDTFIWELTQATGAHHKEVGKRVLLLDGGLRAQVCSVS